MQIRKLTKDEVTIEVHIERETAPIHGNASAIDPVTDREIEQEIVAQLRAGNEWAWCVVTVAARWGEFMGTADLGGCSYESEAKFREPDGCFDDMCDEALDNLNTQITNAFEAIKALLEP